MKIPGGYYIKARKIQDSWISHASPVVRETWDFLLREANHKDKKYSGFIVKRGQLFRSYKEIRDGLKWGVGFRFQRYTENQMKHCMKLLRREGMIELMGQPRGNLITIINYDLYQDPKNYESTNEPTDESTNDQPMINQSSLPINKNVKKERINIYSADAKKVLIHLNKTGGKKFKVSDSNLKHIESRLKENFSLEDCFKVLETKINDPYFRANPKYYNPETLFRPSNFEKYLNENGVTKNNIVNPEWD